jgi:hypothetical protein
LVISKIEWQQYYQIIKDLEGLPGTEDTGSQFLGDKVFPLSLCNSEEP